MKTALGAAGLCLFLCPLPMEFEVFWYETLIRENGEPMPGFIGPSDSVRLRRRLRRRNC